MLGQYFNTVMRENEINEAINWMRPIVNRSNSEIDISLPHYLDTYANLLSKAGKTEEAISKEKRAIALAIEYKLTQKEIDAFQKTLSRMREQSSNKRL